MTSKHRLRNREELERCGGASPTSGIPSIAWNSALAPSTSNIRGTMSTCTR